ncbi:MAG: ABC transporter ATP-binding protein [Micropepsaceae bacterium]
MSEAPAVLELRNIVRSFSQASGTLEVFKNASATIRRGEIVTLVGPSGAGKSSLLHIAGLLERPTSGEVVIAGRAVSSLSERERTATRRNALGFVYQFHHLLPEFSALENVMMPMRLAGQTKSDAAVEARRLLDLVGLTPRLDHRPAQLSGGEQQRVAIARALANKPQLLLADEPTGNLDPKTADLVFEVLLGIVRAEGLAALIATHNHKLINYTDRTLLMHEGKLVDGGKLTV